MKTYQSFGFLAAALLVVGCNATGAMAPAAAMPTGSAGKGTFTPNSPAGIEVAPQVDPTLFGKLVASRNSAGSFGVARSDPFSLTSSEAAFDKQQDSERFLGASGGFSTNVQEKETVDEVLQPMEAQPYRRLSGIVVGDSVLAIYEEEGQKPIIIQPGMRIPNSPWRVVSIDQDKAVLRRDGNVRPTQVIVRLETSRVGTQSDAGGAPSGSGGMMPGGPSGMGPGGPGSMGSDK